MTPTLSLGATTYDVTTRALVMGVLNRTTDSFFSPAATFELDALYARAAALVDEGADVLDVGGVRAGPGPEVTEDEELDRVVPVIEALRDRFEVPLSIDTWRASVAEASFAAGAVLGNDISGFADERYLEVAAAAGASVVATHIRLRPRVPDPDPRYDDVVACVARFLTERAERARAAGIPTARIVVDAGLDLGKTPAQSLELLRASATLADARAHPAPLGLQQAVPRRGARTRDRGAQRRVAGGRRARHRRSAAGCCGSTTSVGRSGSVTRSGRSSRPR